MLLLVKILAIKIGIIINSSGEKDILEVVKKLEKTST